MEYSNIISYFSLTSAIYKSKHKTAMANFPLPDVLLNSLSKKKKLSKKIKCTQNKTTGRLEYESF